MESWSERYTPAPITELNRVGAPNWQSFVIQSGSITPVLERELRRYLGPNLASKRILDFGCGVGRVALNLHAHHGAPAHACDVNAGAVEYLQGQLPTVDCRVTGFSPPLPYPDNYFDAVYSVSVWTHLPPEMEMPWLKEINRILKPGGVALITTSGGEALKRRHARKDRGWERYGIQDLRDRGILYIEYDPADRPGITGSYGLTAHHPDYVRREWGRYFYVREVRQAAVNNVQDLVVLLSQKTQLGVLKARLRARLSALGQSPRQSLP